MYAFQFGDGAESLSGESLGHEWEELGDRRMQCEVVVGRDQESFDGFSSECAGELVGEPSGRCAERDCGIDAAGTPRRGGHNSLFAGA